MRGTTPSVGPSCTSTWDVKPQNKKGHNKVQNPKSKRATGPTLHVHTDLLLGLPALVGGDAAVRGLVAQLDGSEGQGPAHHRVLGEVIGRAVAQHLAGKQKQLFRNIQLAHLKR